MSNEIYNTEYLIHGRLLTKKMKIAILCCLIYIIINFSRLPTHVPLLQAFVSVLGPEQSAPPSEGGGLVQVRVRSFVPFPQVTLHSPNSPQSLHPPLPIAGRKVFQWTGNLVRSTFHSVKKLLSNLTFVAKISMLAKH